MNPQQLLAESVDKSQVPAIEKKRMMAFVNRFIISTSTFLNTFAQQCEEKFIDMERKMQRVEASLVILEAKLDSISPDTYVTDPNEVKNKESNLNNNTQPPPPPTEAASSAADEQKTENSSKPENATNMQTEEAAMGDNTSNLKEPTAPPENGGGVRACEDSRYKKFFKMVTFGVPPEAVKLKMRAEGFDGSILDSPNSILTDGSIT